MAIRVLCEMGEPRVVGRAAREREDREEGGREETAARMSGVVVRRTIFLGLGKCKTGVQGCP